MQYIYNNIMYAELNTKSDYCECCGYDGEIQIKEDDGKLISGNARTAVTAIRISYSWQEEPVDTSVPSSGTRDVPRRSRIVYYICNINEDMSRLY